MSVNTNEALAERGEFVMQVGFYGNPPGWWITVERLPAGAGHLNMSGHAVTSDRRDRAGEGGARRRAAAVAPCGLARAVSGCS
jgi:hypothetical protein